MVWQTGTLLSSSHKLCNISVCRKILKNRNIMFFMILSKNHLDKDCKYKKKGSYKHVLFVCIQGTWNSNIMLVLYKILSEKYLNKDCSCKAKVHWNIIFQNIIFKEYKHKFLAHHLTTFKNSANDFSFIVFLTSWLYFFLVYLLIAFSPCICFPFPLLLSSVFPVPIQWSYVQLLFDLGLCHLALCHPFIIFI